MALFSQDDRNSIPVLVNGKPYNVPRNTTPEEMMNFAGIDPSNHSLMVVDQNGLNNVVPKGQRIQPVRGQNFDATLPWRGGC